jgi:CRISPR type IV-associated protein Csf2
MKTYILEGVVTAISSISHNGGERNGTITQLRREKFVQPNGKVSRVPVISGNAIRGILRDRGMLSMLRQLGYGVNEETGEVKGLPLNAFYFLFSGGSLTSTGSGEIDIKYFRDMRDTIPLISLFGGAVGNMIMPGKMKIGKLIPMCTETAHLIPERFLPETVQTIWEYCQTEMYTRRDDEKNDRVRALISRPVLNETNDNTPAEKKGTPQQMKYDIETLAAGTQFFWKIVLEDVTDVEFEAFLSAILDFSKSPNIGGKGAVGHGEISIKLDRWVEIDSRVNLQGTELDVTLGTKYKDHLEKNGDSIRVFLNQMK